MVIKTIVKAVQSILPKKKETVTQTIIAPKTQEPVRVIDVTTTPPGGSGPDRTGSITVKGSGSSARVVEISGDVPTVAAIQQSLSAQDSSSRPTSTIEAVQQQKGLEGARQKLQQRIDLLKARQQRTRPGASYSGEFKRQLRELEMAGLAAGRTVVGGVIGIGSLLAALPKAPGFILNALKNPKATGIAIVSAAEETPAAIKRAGDRAGYMAQTSPGEFVGVVAGEVLLFKGTSKGLKVVGRLTDEVGARLNPKFIGVLKTGQKVKIRTIGGGNPNVELKVVGKIPRESMAVQVGRAGRKVTAVSSQQEPLINLIKKSRVVRKPIPNEDRLPKRAKNLLKKFDEKTINRRELIELDTIIKRRSGKGILERSFFADPAGRVRPSRLGVVKDDEARLIDVLSGDVTFKRAKPQILVFPNVKVQRLPKSLNSVKKKLRAGKPLTQKEANALLSWQQKQSGKFKPIGFVTREAEVSLAPGEVIKRVKKIGVALIKGKKVPIIQAKVSKVTKGTQRLLSKAQKGTITKRELSKLRRNLKKETGFKLPKSSIEYRGKRISLRRLGTSLSSRALSKARYKRGLSSRIKSPARSRYVSSPRSGPRYSPKSGVSKTSGTRGSPGVSPRRSPKGFSYGGSGGRSLRAGRGAKTLLRRDSRRGRLRGIPEKNVGYHVYGKAGKRFIKLTKQPLKKADAKSRGAYAIDHTTSRTFVIKPAGPVKKFGQLKKWERGYISRSSHKFRSYRVRKGRAIGFKKERLIEKRRYGIDTSGEKRQLSLARYAKQHGLAGRISAAASRDYPPSKPRYRYVSGGLFGGTRRVLIRPKTKVNTSHSVKKKYKIIKGGMFGQTRRVPIKSQRSAPRRSNTSKPRYRYVSQGLFSAPRRVLVKPSRRSRSRPQARNSGRVRPKYRYVSTGLFGSTRRVLLRSRKSIKRSRPVRHSRRKSTTRRRSSGGLLDSGGFMG